MLAGRLVGRWPSSASSATRGLREDRLHPRRRLLSPVPATNSPRPAPFARVRRWGSRLVPHVGGLKRGLKRGRTLSLSCTNTAEVQVNLDGRIHPRTARPQVRLAIAADLPIG